jgi:hypothetical protein
MSRVSGGARRGRRLHGAIGPLGAPRQRRAQRTDRSMEAATVSANCVPARWIA